MHGRNTIAILAFALVAVPMAARGEGACEGYLTGSRVPEALLEVIRQNGFQIDRGLPEYSEALGPRFCDDLSRLGPDGHWVDMGAGRGNALGDYVRGLERDAEPFEIGLNVFFRIPKSLNDSLAKPYSARASVTGITYDAGHAPSAVDEPRARLLSGRLFEDIPLQEIGRADLITDYFGVFAYSPRIDATLTRYLALLKDGGAIYVAENGAALKSTLVTTAGGRQLDVVEWLRGLKGLDVGVHETPHGMTTLRLSCPAGCAGVRVPPLELISSKPGKPPARSYREAS